MPVFLFTQKHINLFPTFLIQPFKQYAGRYSLVSSPCSNNDFAVSKEIASLSKQLSYTSLLNSQSGEMAILTPHQPESSISVCPFIILLENSDDYGMSNDFNNVPDWELNAYSLTIDGEEADVQSSKYSLKLNKND